MADDTLRLPCGCVKKYYAGVGWDFQPCSTHAKHKFDPGGRAHWEKPRCKDCQAFEDHPIHDTRPKNYTEQRELLDQSLENIADDHPIHEVNP